MRHFFVEDCADDRLDTSYELLGLAAADLLLNCFERQHDGLRVVLAKPIREVRLRERFNVHREELKVLLNSDHRGIPMNSALDTHTDGEIVKSSRISIQQWRLES